MNLHLRQASHKTPSANGAVITVTRSSVSAVIHVANYSPLPQSNSSAINIAYTSIREHLQSWNAFCNFAKQTIKHTEDRTMATITLEYDGRNVGLKKLIEAMIALGATVVQPKGKPSKSGLEQSMDDIKNGRVTTHKSVEDYFKKNKLL